jgi:CrcB protein
MQTLLALVYVGLGSMLGGLSRYGLTLATQNISAFSIPYGTLVSNLVGCLAIGIIAGLSGKTELMSTEMRLLLATGFCGGFTTMSSFIYELGQFVQDKEFFFASTYFVATLAGAGLAFALRIDLFCRHAGRCGSRIRTGAGDQQFPIEVNHGNFRTGSSVEDIYR